jgi:hypothetical protein
MKTLPSHSLRCFSGATCLLLSALAYNAPAANQYFDVNGTTAGYGIVSGSTYYWDDPNWAAASGGGAATGNWVGGNFARFYGGTSGDSYTVLLNNDESMAGLYGYIAGVTVTINDGGFGLGDLNIVSGDQGFIANGTVTINAPVTGIGGLAPEGPGRLYLYGQNTYSGGTAFGYYNTPLTYFNNSSSFGTGPIKFGVAGTALFQGMLATGGAKVTLPNVFQNLVSGSGINFAADANTPLELTGNWTLGANNINIRSSGGATAPVAIQGALSGTANVTFSANNAGNLITLSGANTYSGTTTLTGPAATGGGSGAITLKLGAANTLASSSSVILAGGILDPGGFHHTMSATTLSLTDNSVIDFGSGASELDFANSAATAWTAGKVLNLANWNPVEDFLRFGTDNTGLLATQVAQIEINGDASTLGTATIDANGFVVIPIPEPSLAALGVLGALGLWTARRKNA